MLQLLILKIVSSTDTKSQGKEEKAWKLLHHQKQRAFLDENGFRTESSDCAPSGFEDWLVHICFPDGISEAMARRLNEQIDLCIGQEWPDMPVCPDREAQRPCTR